MNIEASSIHASPVSQPDVPHVSATPLDTDLSGHRDGASHVIISKLGTTYSTYESHVLLRLLILLMIYL